MSNRFTKSAMNWVEFAKRVPPDQKGKFLAFKAKSEMYLRRMEASPPEPPKIDWDTYKNIVPVEGLVESFQKAYAEFEIPFPEDTVSDKIDKQWKDLQPEINAFCADRQKEIDDAQREIDRIDLLPKYDDITMEMWYEMDPKNAFDPVNKPTFWPHNPEEQLGYMTPEQKAAKKTQ